MGSGVGEDSDTGLGEFGLGGTGKVRRDSAECDPAVLGDLVDVHGLDLPLHGLVEVDVVPDLEDVSESLSLGPLGCVQSLDLEIRVVLEHLDESLTDHSGCSENCYTDLAHLGYPFNGPS